MGRLLPYILVALGLLLTTGADSPVATAEAAVGSVAALREAPLPVGPHASSDSVSLFTFEGPDAATWTVENDGVMGGRSQGDVEVATGTLVFTGEVVTEGGGFSSVRAERQVDLSGYDGIALRVRGGGRTFELDVDDGTRSRGREVNRRGPVPTSDGWQTVRVPFDALEASAHGEPVSVGPLDRSAVQSIGIYIIDGQDGPFRLEIDWVRAYREVGATAEPAGGQD